jgi:hypothetical protein
MYFVDSPRQSDPAVAVVDIQAGSTFSFSRPSAVDRVSMPV